MGEIEIDEPRHRVTVRGKEVNLTPMEFELLYFLAANAGHVFDRETLFREVWGYDYVGETNLVDVCVRRLREKSRSRTLASTPDPDGARRRVQNGGSVTSSPLRAAHDANRKINRISDNLVTGVG